MDTALPEKLCTQFLICQPAIMLKFKFHVQRGALSNDKLNWFLATASNVEIKKIELVRKEEKPRKHMRD